MSTVSVIIVNWNGKRLLPECLDTVRIQTHPADEILIVDNGSRDGSQEMIRAQYPEVKLIELDRNKGFSVANNIGIAHAQGEYIALLNNDLSLDPNWIERMAAALDADDSLGSCACKMLSYDHRNIIDAAGDSFLTSGIAVNRGALDVDAELYRRPQEVFGACAGAAIYRASMLRDIGLFDEELYMYCEDVDLSFRAQLAGYNCLFVPDAIAYHHHAASSAGLQGFTRRNHLIVRNSLLVVVKDMPTPLLFRYLPFILAGQIPFALQVGMRRQVRGYTVACLEALRMLPSMLHKRRAIQRAARRRPEEIAARLTPGVPH